MSERIYAGAELTVTGYFAGVERKPYKDKEFCTLLVKIPEEYFRGYTTPEHVHRFDIFGGLLNAAEQLAMNQPIKVIGDTRVRKVIGNDGVEKTYISWACRKLQTLQIGDLPAIGSSDNSEIPF